MNKIVMFLIFILPVYLFSQNLALDENEDGKYDRWMTLRYYKSWRALDKNGNNIADESVFFINEKNNVYLIVHEKYDYNSNGKPDIFIYNKVEGKDFFSTIKIDQNQDGNIDLIREEKNNIPITQKADEDFDGVFEKTEFYDAKGNKIKEGIDTNNDGTLNDYYYFKNNLLVLQEFDSNNDGKIDMWVKTEYDSMSKIKKVIIEKDNNYDGKVDEWHFTNDKREVVRIEKDTNFDGKPDDIKKFK